MAGERVIKTLKRAGVAIAAAGVIAFGTDTFITGNAADARGFNTPSERVTFLNDFRGRRSSFEIAGFLAGIALISGGKALGKMIEGEPSDRRNLIVHS